MDESLKWEISLPARPIFNCNLACTCINTLSNVSRRSSANKQSYTVSFSYHGPIKDWVCRKSNILHPFDTALAMG